MLLTDDHTDVLKLPTRDMIMVGFEWLMKGLQAGDVLFFYFAGDLFLYSGGEATDTLACSAMHAGCPW